MKVKILVQPNCMPCKITKKYLKKLDIDFEEVYSDASLINEAKRELTKRGLPLTSPVVYVTLANGEQDVFSGFQPEKLNALKA